VDMKLEVVVVPVFDVDKAKDFYQALGWRLDADFVTGADFRVVQLTPPGSACSVIFGTGLTSAVPGSAQGLQLGHPDPDRRDQLRHTLPIRRVGGGRRRRARRAPDDQHRCHRRDLRHRRRPAAHLRLRRIT
jgi:catechol 2,3-dioxygenase-like lactoylglutathione lyase family enzyme